MKCRTWIVALACAVPFVATVPAQAENKSTKTVLSFGTLRAPSTEEARAQSLDWLKSTGKADETSLKAFESIWSQPQRPLVDRVAETLALGDAEAGKFLNEARADDAPAPLTVPAALKDARKPTFFRANLALAYARALSKRRVYEESLETLKAVKPEQVLDPATYLFHRAVAEYELANKDEATRTIARLLEEAVDAPERYKLVASLMAADMQSWKNKDLGWIARKMDNIERRLELARGGPQTQKLQKEVISRLDELIKQIENQAKGSSQPNAGACPNGGQPGQGQQQGNQFGQLPPNAPQKDSFGGTNSGPGKVDQKKLDGLAKQWGKLPPKEQAKAMQELIRDMPTEYRELIETYFRKLAQNEASRP